MSLQGGAREREEKGRMVCRRKVETLVTLTACWQPLPSLLHLLLSFPVSMRQRQIYKCAGGRKLESKLNFCLDETSGTDRDTVNRRAGHRKAGREEQAEKNTKGLQSDSITDTTTEHPKFPLTTWMNSTAMLVFKSCLGKLVGMMLVRESLASCFECCWDVCV